MRLICRNRYLFILYRVLIKSFNHFFDLNDYYDTLIYQRQLIYYQSKGATIGKNTILLNVNFSSSGKGDKFFIGDNCTLTGCTLIAHDASVTLFIEELNKRHPPYLRCSRFSYRKEIIIGSNVFIGVGAIILPGVQIGDNVIIAAGSVVSTNVESNSVFAGNPAKFIKHTNEVIDKYRLLLATNPELF